MYLALPVREREVSIEMTINANICSAHTPVVCVCVCMEKGFFYACLLLALPRMMFA
jgi:hypothetical protein